MIILTCACKLNDVVQKLDGVLSFAHAFNPTERLLLKADVADVTSQFQLLGYAVTMSDRRRVFCIAFMVYIPLIIVVFD